MLSLIHIYAEAKVRALELMEHVGLAGQMKKKTGKYSRGMRPVSYTHLAAGHLFATENNPNNDNKFMEDNLNLIQEWDKTFPQLSLIHI